MSRREVGRGGRRAGVVCLLGIHQYGEGHGIGAGISRRACEVCGLVTIDLTGADEPSELGAFGGRRGTASLGSDR